LSCVFETLSVLWNKTFFTKRCAFRHSTRLYKNSSRLLKNECINRKKRHAKFDQVASCIEYSSRGNKRTSVLPKYKKYQEVRRSTEKYREVQRSTISTISTEVRLFPLGILALFIQIRTYINYRVL
jgi:hypothetical protein